jgi:argininosuccinate lyase
MSYNLDLQEITPTIWASSEAIQDVTSTLRILVSKIRVSNIEMNRADLVTTTSTEIANVMVTEFGLPFRLAHQLVASAASEFSQSGSHEADAWLELVCRKAEPVVRDRSGKLKADLSWARTLGTVVMRKRSIGSPAPRETLRLLKERIASLGKTANRQRVRRKRLVQSKVRLQREMLRLTR